MSISTSQTSTSQTSTSQTSTSPTSTTSVVRSCRLDKNNIAPEDFHKVSLKLREFFISKGLTETWEQHRPSILAACENPDSIGEYFLSGVKYALPQTNQMWLEHELLQNPTSKGYFCFTTSYRDEKSPIEGRHLKIFPMAEFEFPGTIDDLVNFETELLQHLGYPLNESSGDKKEYKKLDYLTYADENKVTELGHEHEQKMEKEFGSVIFLQQFPIDQVFWNMKRSDDSKRATANKIDVILSGIETIGSAERACDTEDMRRMFYTTADGKYAQTLIDRFSKERVAAELENFLSYRMIPRCGGGIGISRLISSMKKEGLL